MDLATPPAGATRRYAIAPPPALAGLVHHFHVEHASEGHVVVPATPFPHVTFFLAGGSLLPPEDGRRTLLHQPFVTGPLSLAIPAEWQPGTTFISALFYPSVFAPLFGIPLNELLNLPVPLHQLAPGLETDPVQARLLAACRVQQWVDILAAWLLALARRRETELRGAFRLAPALLHAPAAEIALQYGLGVRQFERRYLAAYGLSLRDSRKLGRYTRALARMIAAPLERGGLTRIAMDCGYYDQAHMVRDFISFLGRPPGSLLGMGAPLRLLHYDDASRGVVIGGDW